MLIDIVAHESRAGADKAWSAVAADPEWRAAWSTAEHERPLVGAASVSTFMSLTDFSPDLPPRSGVPGGSRVFELRKYNTGPDGLDYTVDRFRVGMAQILSDVGMTPLAYWTADDRSWFIYLVAHKDRDAARASWSNFMTPYRAFMTKYTAEHSATSNPQGRRSPEDNRMLVPTDYSPIR